MPAGAQNEQTWNRRYLRSIGTRTTLALFPICYIPVQVRLLGICVYEGDLLPSALRGQLIHCDAGPSVTRAYVTTDSGAGYSAEIVNILKGTRDQWFRPSDVKVAPDGSLFVADWYDPGVGGHRMGDIERGRVFRVIPKGHDGSYSVPELNLETVAGAVSALRNPNNSIRYLAWTALNRMGEAAEPELLKMWEDDRNPRMRARALWLLGKIPGRGAHYVDLASRDAHKNIRCQSIRLARQLKDVDVLPVVARLVDDSSPAVRRECAIAIRHSKSEEAANLWAKLASHHDGSDRWYLEALGDRRRQTVGTVSCRPGWSPVDGKWNTTAGRDLIWRSRGSKTAEWLKAVVSGRSCGGCGPASLLPCDRLSAGNRTGTACRRSRVQRSERATLPVRNW